MKSVSNLTRVWCPQTHAISDAETTITRYDPRTGMVAKPGRQGCGLIVGQHVNRVAYCQVHQEQAIAQWSSVQREVIHSQLRRRLTHGELLVAQQTAQGIWTGWQTRSARESGSSFTAGPLGEREQEASRLFRPAAVVRQESRESLRKNLPRASGFIAEEAPRPDAQAHGELAPGQVQCRASIPRMPPRTPCLTHRANRVGRARNDAHRYRAIWLDRQAGHSPAVRPHQQIVDVHCGPPAASLLAI